MIRLDREVTVPADFHLTLATARPELLRIINRELTKEEGRAVADAMATLMSTLMRTHGRLEQAEGVEAGRIKEELRRSMLELGDVRTMKNSGSSAPSVLGSNVTGYAFTG